MERSQQVAGMAIPSWAPQHWPGWFAGANQPFVVDGLPPEDVEALPTAVVGATCRGEVRDSFWIYDRRPRLWLTEPEFNDLDKGLRTRLVRGQLRVHESIGVVRKAPVAVRDQARAQIDGYRFVWWPTLLDLASLEPIIELIESGVVPSRHREVPARVWQQATAVLPHAQDLAGTLPIGSGPNCFGTVMAAAGVPGAADEWMQLEPFADWIRTHTRPGGRDDSPGTVLVWCNQQGDPVHAAVTLGGGWALNKPSQAWSSPRFVWTVKAVINYSRQRACHLHRRTVTG